MRIVLPMAGRGSRFHDHGVFTPKPLIPVAGRPMVAWALDGLRGLAVREVVFVVLEEHAREHRLRELLPTLSPWPARVVAIPEVTEGQLCTVLAARAHFEHDDDDLLVAASDTWVDARLTDKLAARTSRLRGVISTLRLPGDRWSFARTDEQGAVVEVAEKRRISDHASTGLYWFASGRELASIADAMIAAGERTRGEFYVIPAYRHLFERGSRVELCEAAGMWDMGTPEALAAFEAHLASNGGRP